MKKLLILFLFVLLPLFSLTIPAYGQQPGGHNVPFQVIDIGPSGPSSVPISGLAVLAVLGGGYAMKKLRDSKNEE